MLLDAFFAVLPVFLVILLGVALHRRDILPEKTGGLLSMYVLKAALPALLLHLLAGAAPEDWLHPGLWLGALGAQFLVYAAGYWGDLLFFRRGVGPAMISALGCSSCNAAFVGLPIIFTVFHGNAEAMTVAGLVVMTPTVTMVLSQIRFDLLGGASAWARDNHSFQWKLLHLVVLGNPALLAAIIGTFLSLSGVGLWEPLDRTAEMVGLTAAPCMLLAMGFDLRHRMQMVVMRGHRRAVVWQSWILTNKLLVCPLVAWGVMELIGLPPLWIAVTVLLCATGSAMIAAVLSAVYSSIPEEASLTAVLSNVLSLFTLTGFIWLFQSLGYM